MQLSVFKLIISFLFFFPISFLSAQPKSLDWDQITVDAFLDQDGNLEVVEWQKIRLTGNWNGAYRKFDVGWGQKLQMIGIERKDEKGNWNSLQSGNTIFVDSYEFDPLNHEAKWRSRLAEDPPFNNDILEYKIHIRYKNILESRGDRVFVLNHDFSFSDRNGQIGSMRVNLKLDDKWKVKARDDKLLTFLSPSALSSNDKMIVNLELNFLDPDFKTISPSKLDVYSFRILSLFLVLSLLAGINYWIYLYAKRKGAMDDPIHILDWKEFLNLLGDLKPEYIAILAESGVTETWMTRLIFEGKLSCQKLEDGKLILQKLVPDDSFSEADRDIIKHLFVVDGPSVSSEQVRDYYRSKKISYSLGSDINGKYSSEMEKLGYTTARNSFIEKVTSYLVDKIFVNSFVFILTIISFGIIYFLFLAEPLIENGVSFGRFIVSFIFTLAAAFVVSLTEDIHYGFYDIELYRKKFFYLRYLKSLIPGTILLAFYIWSLEISDAFYFLLLFVSGFISFQHLIRLSPHTHIRQIQSTLKALSLKNFLQRRLLSNEKCDIPLTFSPLIPALDLSFSLRYRKENLNLDDTRYLLPEFYQENVNLHVNLSPSSVSVSSRMSTGSLGSNNSFNAGGGEFGGAGSSATWSDMESFSSSSSYTTPSSSSSSSGSSSSGGGGGGGW